MFFGKQGSEKNCINGFRNMKAQEVLDILNERFEEVKTELGAICGCEKCGTLAVSEEWEGTEVKRYELHHCTLYSR